MERPVRKTEFDPRVDLYQVQDWTYLETLPPQRAYSYSVHIQGDIYHLLSSALEYAFTESERKNFWENDKINIWFYWDPQGSIITLTLHFPAESYLNTVPPASYARLYSYLKENLRVNIFPYGPESETYYGIYDLYLHPAALARSVEEYYRNRDILINSMYPPEREKLNWK